MQGFTLEPQGNPSLELRRPAGSRFSTPTDTGYSRMKNLLLRRVSHTTMGTFGELSMDGQHLAYTVERPWKNNELGVSCIPAGIYYFNPHYSPKFGDVRILTGGTVGINDGDAHRSHILMHAANRAIELQGCIAPGLSFGALRRDWAVMSSADAIKGIMDILGDDPAQIWIAWDLNPEVA